MVSKYLCLSNGSQWQFSDGKTFRGLSSAPDYSVNCLRVLLYIRLLLRTKQQIQVHA